QDFAYDCCLHIAAFTPLYPDTASVDKQYVAEQTEIFTKQVAELDKPENVKAGIVQGKIKKHLSEICFLEQPFVKDDKLSVSKKMEEVGKAAGGKISLSKMVLFQLGA
ncbi:MAG TPA: elongation factor Ts, partial [Treponemataceae bacterium]|nr:elongation factor Ts [Treponemataceae bacterium]